MQQTIKLSSEPGEFDAWMQERYGDMFDITGQDADTSTRLVRAVAWEAWQAGREHDRRLLAEIEREAREDLASTHRLRAPGTKSKRHHRLEGVCIGVVRCMLALSRGRGA